MFQNQPSRIRTMSLFVLLPAESVALILVFTTEPTLWLLILVSLVMNLVVLLQKLEKT